MWLSNRMSDDSMFDAAELDPGGATRLLDERGNDAVVIYAPEPWETLGGAERGIAGIEAPGVGRDVLDTMVATAPQRSHVIGLGGGSALDAAKYLAWRRELPLDLVPSILSVDAAFTREAGVRVDGVVTYMGQVEPERIVIDPELIRTAPPPLNRAGVGDLLSCHTALWDWRAAVDAGHPAGPAVAWDEQAAGLAQELLAQLERLAMDVFSVSDVGIALLSSGFRRVGAQCTRLGHARFEEGSEHFLAYALEKKTGRSYVHGELISFTTLALAVTQDNDPLRVAQIVARSGVRADPVRLGLDESLFVAVMVSLREHVREHNLWWSVIDMLELDERRAKMIWNKTLSLLEAAKQAHGS